MEITLTKDNFEAEVLKSDLPIIVDFWATWCGPCKVMGPILSRFAEENDGKIKVGKVDVDQNNELASQYGIMSIPTIKIFKAGKIVGELVGATPFENLSKIVSNSLK